MFILNRVAQSCLSFTEANHEQGWKPGTFFVTLDCQNLELDFETFRFASNNMSFVEAHYTIYIGLVAVILILFQQCYKIGHRPSNYPPGPPTLPLLGNLHQIPSEKRHLQFEKWARQYGPIYSLILGTKVMIVLNSDLAIKELIDRRGAIYSSRPEAYIAQNVLSGGLRVLFMVRLTY